MKKDWIQLSKDWLGGEAFAIKDSRRVDALTVEESAWNKLKI